MNATTKRFASAIASIVLISTGLILDTMKNALAVNLSQLSDSQWDEYSGDNTRFDGIVWSSENCRETQDDRSKTPTEIAQLYTKLSTTVLGKRYTMTAGYLYDKSYHCGQGKWHAGIDIGAPAGTSVKALGSGTVAWISEDPQGGAFIAVNDDKDGKQWVYGHLQSYGNFRQGSRITKEQIMGQVGSQSGAKHLHIEVRTPPFKSTGGANSNQDFVRNATMSPLQAFWSKSNNGTPTPEIPFAQPANSKLTISVSSVDLTVNASNLPGRMVYVQMWRPATAGYSEKEWNLPGKQATGTSITFNNIEGDGNSFAGVNYYTVASLSPIPSGEAKKQRTSCYNATGGKYFCDTIRR